jgi:hypothetical protein
MLSKNSPYIASIHIHRGGWICQLPFKCHLCGNANPWEYFRNQYICSACEQAYTLKDNAEGIPSPEIIELTDHERDLIQVVLATSENVDDVKRAAQRKRDRQEPRLSGDPEYDQT